MDGDLGVLLGGAKPALKSPDIQADNTVSTNQDVIRTATNIDPQTWLQDDVNADTPPRPSPISRDSVPAFPTVNVDKEIPATGSTQAAGINAEAEVTVDQIKIDMVEDDVSVDIIKTDIEETETKSMMAEEMASKTLDTTAIKDDLVNTLDARIEEMVTPKFDSLTRAFDDLTMKIETLETTPKATISNVSDSNGAEELTKAMKEAMTEMSQQFTSVSYTHLTLPTICSV